MDIKLITLSNYVRPDVVENKSRNWVLNGRNNEFYDYIIDRHNGSPTNSSINNSYIDLIYGRGLGFKNGINGTNDWARLQGILGAKDLRKMIADYQIFGEFSFQVIETKGKDLHSLIHIAKEKVVPSIENEKNEIVSYWYSNNWKNVNKNKPIEIPAFGIGKGKTIYCAKPYKVGQIYFSSPDYLAGLPYAEMEEEIANMNINSIKQGLSAGYIINIPDGKSWTDEDKESFEKKIRAKLTGSPNASNFILSFNGRDVEINITPFPVNDNIHKQWQFLVEESKTQIMTSHRVVSPSLVGLSSASGFSSVADEMDMSEKQTIKRVIQPKQNFILDALSEVLVAYGINLDLYFKPLTEEEGRANKTAIGADEPSSPISDDTAKAQAALRGSVGGVQGVLGVQQSVSEGKTDFDSAVTILMEIYGFDREVSKALLGKPKNKLGLCSHTQLSENIELEAILEKYAQDPPEGYELTDGTEYDLQLSAKQTSEQDTKLWKTRYQYTKGTSKSPKGGSRLFCNKMMLLADTGKVYRKEDIELMSMQGVNGQFAHSGGKYDIFLYGGGVNCYHRWERRVFKKKLDADGNPKKGNAMQQTDELNVNEARRQGYKPPKNPKDVAIAEIDKPTKGKYVG